jgi:preprotein translocase subunit SecG
LITFLTVLLVIDVLVLMLLVVGLQHGNEGGMGSAFGSGNSAGFFGASGGVSFIVRATWIAGALFFVLALSLAWLKTREHYGVGREVEKLLGTEVPAAPAPLATATPAAALPAETPAAATTPAATPAQ